MTMNRSLSLTSLFIALAALFVACGGDSTSSTTPTPTETTSSGTFTISDLTVGTGTQATAGRTLTVAYTGWLYDTSKTDGKGRQFDSGASFSFPLGVGRVIAGWDQGVPGMRVGGQRRLIIPPALAYGATGVPAVPGNAGIPPNATLVFDIGLSNVQ
jgi:FKBP-type peptidyl-prolyl cis-trans isomerase FkpA